MRMQSRTRCTRPGFTLVELMIVVIIVLLLVAMATSAVLKFRNTGPYTATVMNLQKIKAALDTQWTAIKDKAQRDTLASPSPKVRKDYVNAKLQQAFPMSFNDVFNPPGGLATYPAYVEYLKSFGVNLANAGATKATAEDQQSICLLMALSVGPSNGGLTADVLGTSATRQVEVLTGTFAYGCADAWGESLLFTTKAQGADPLVPAVVSRGPNRKWEGSWKPNAETSDDISSMNN